MGHITATKLTGSRKQEIEFNIKDETGRKVFGALGEVETLKFDKRRRRKTHDYVTLINISKNPRLDLTYNLATREYFLVHHGGIHFWYLPLDQEVLVKLLTVSHMSKTYDYHSLSGNVIIPPEIAHGIAWYKSYYQTKIVKGRKRRFKSHQLRKARALKGAPPPYKPKRKGRK